jgi:hypothetical protein
VEPSQLKICVLCGVNMMFTDRPSFEALDPMWAELRIDVVHAGKRITGDVRPLPVVDPLVTGVLNNSSRQPESAEEVPVLWLFAPCSTTLVESGAHGDFVTRMREDATRMLMDQRRSCSERTG